MIHPDIIGVRTLIFDMDGTLIRSGELALTALRRGIELFYSQRGLTPPDYSDERLVSGIGAPSDTFYKSLLDDANRDAWPEFRDLIFAEEEKYLETHRITFPGAVKTLGELKRRGYRTALVSNCNTPYLNAVLDTQGLRRHFDMTLCIGDWDGATKTALVRDVLKQLGGPAAVIGDREYDVEAAHANNIPAVGALYGYGTREQLMGTATWVEDVRDLVHIFYPLRELAERLAIRINELRQLDRPTVVALSAPHDALTTPLVRLLLSELTDRNIPAVHLKLDRHRAESSATDPSEWIGESYPWERLERDILESRATGRIDTTWPVVRGVDAGGSKPYRARPGSVMLVESPFLVNSRLEQPFDLKVWVHAGVGTVPRAIRHFWKNEAKRNMLLGHPRHEADLQAEEGIQADTSQWSGPFHEAVAFHLKHDRPEELADVVVDGVKLDRGVMLS